MKKCIIVLLLACSSLLSTAQALTDSEFQLFKESVAVMGTYTRNLNGKAFVKEIRLVNFSSQLKMPVGYGLKGEVLADNGKGYDLKAGDGIYTSIGTYPITGKQAANAVGISVPVMQKVVVDQGFKYENDLDSRMTMDKIKIKVKCNIRFCGCPCQTFTCNACEWFGWSCITFDWCEVEVGFE